MREQCVPDSFFSAHAREPGNEATCHHEHSVACGVHCIRYVNLHKAALVFLPQICITLEVVFLKLHNYTLLVTRSSRQDGLSFKLTLTLYRKLGQK